jgi:hypothetical protein
MVDDAGNQTCAPCSFYFAVLLLLFSVILILLLAGRVGVGKRELRKGCPGSGRSAAQCDRTYGQTAPPPPTTTSEGAAGGGPTRHPGPEWGRGAAPVPDTCDTGLLALWRAFENRSDARGSLGGLLVHNMGVEAFEDWYGAKDFEVRASDSPIVDCAAVSRKTCSAWSYLRADLLPMVFSPPMLTEENQYATPLVGIIADPNVLFPLITTMGIMDSDTNRRNCCTNQTGADVAKRVYFPSASSLLGDLEGGGDLGAGQDWWRPPTGEDTPEQTGCAARCGLSDRSCRFSNSGSGINTDALAEVRSEDGDALGSWEAAYCAARGDADIRDCALCGYAHLCRVEGGTPKPGAWAEYRIDPDSKTAANHVNKDASAFKTLVGARGALRNPFTVAKTQCKFEKEDWAQWVEAIKILYAAWDAAYRPEGAGIELLDRGDGEDGHYGINYLLANPKWWYGYLENEVNLYVNPKPQEGTVLSRQEREWMEEEDRIFRDSILGFLYVGKTCLESVRELDGIATEVDGHAWSDAEGRCYGYLCGAEGPVPTHYKTSPCYRSNVRDERANHLARARDAAVKMTRRFNAKYRGPGSKTLPAVACEFRGDSNLYISYATLQKLKTGGLRGHDVLVHPSASPAHRGAFPLREANERGREEGKESPARFAGAPKSGVGFVEAKEHKIRKGQAKQAKLEGS